MSSLNTGISILDSRLDGGVPEGSVISLVSHPMSMGELFLEQLALTRPTLYFTNSRPSESIVRSIGELDSGSVGEYLDDEDQDELESEETLNVVEVGIQDSEDRDSDRTQTDTTTTTTQDILDGLDSLDTDEPQNVVFDSFSEYVRQKQNEYKTSLRRIHEVTHASSGIACLHITKGDRPLTRDEEYVLGVSDVVFYLMIDPEGDKIENRLAVTKIRDGVPPDETIKLDIGERITVETSREIA